jgi:hypothetical protein
MRAPAPSSFRSARRRTSPGSEVTPELATELGHALADQLRRVRFYAGTPYR